MEVADLPVDDALPDVLEEDLLSAGRINKQKHLSKDHF
jgi:hypothetical protein